MNNDKLKLNTSANFSLANNNEVTVDVNLSQAVLATKGSVSGTVYDTTLLTGTKVAGATVKIFTADGTPYLHTLTGSDGRYTISDLPIGVYKIAAVKDGNYLSVETPLTISNILPVTVNLVILKNNNANKNVIYGKVLDSITKLPVNNVNISLYKITGETRTLIASTTSITDGEYTIEKIDSGTYQLSFDKSGYQTEEVSNIILTNNTKFNANTTLSSLVGSINSTVSGTIKTELGVIVPNAFVGLYKIDGDNETLVQTTYTNIVGKYMFGNVSSGEYVVKAKLAELV